MIHVRPPSPRPGPSARKMGVLALALALGLVSLPESAAGQDGQLRVVPSAGVMVPTSILYRSDLPESTAQLGSAPLISLGVQLYSRSFPFSLRLTLDRVDWFDTEVVGRAEEQDHPFTVPTSITMVTGDLLVHPPIWATVAPYAFVGLGRKNYAFGSESPPGSHLHFAFPEDGTGVRLHYGLGAEFDLSRWTVGVEAGGNFNRFVLVDEFLGISRSQDQHEYVLRVLVPIPLLRF